MAPPPTSSPLTSLINFLAQIISRGNVSKAVAIYALCILYKYRNSVIGVRPRNDLPGPRGIPLLGNIYSVLTTPRNQILQRQVTSHEKFGKVYKFQVPGIGTIINISGPEQVDHVLRINFWAYEKGPYLREKLKPLVGQGIFGADGEHWRWQRKLAAHIFTAKAFREWTGNAFCNKGQLVVDYLSIMADSGQPVDLQEIYYKFTLDSFGEIAFGESFGCLDKPGDEVPFALAFDRLNHNLSERFLSPVWRIRNWYEGKVDTMEEDTRIVEEFCYGVIRRRKELGTKNHKDLMQLFMDTTDDNGETLDDEKLKDTLMNFIIAGRDTTAQALSWMFYLMHRQDADPAVVKTLQEETDRVLQGGLPTYDTVKQMKYTEACFHETLRLYPSVAKNIKVCVQDDVLPGGFKVYKDEKIGWSSWAMGRNEDIWGPDAKKFNPDRWLTGEKPSSSKFVSFHLGPRTCLGQQFATIEAITLTAMLLQKFTFELVTPDSEPAYLPSLTLPMANGLPVRVKHRVL
ncbi:hypothetical protein BGZ93_006861 [Podila epicladia]|nr:hypothetical protein BGZ93_006861 [Podila epicladia]